MSLCEEAETLARALNQVNTLAYMHFHAAMPALLDGDVARVGRHAAPLMAMAEEHDLALWRAWACFYEGWLLARWGRLAEGAGVIERMLAEVEVTGARQFRPLFQLELAKLLASQGRVDEALAVAAEARSEIEATGAVCFEAEAWRVLGESVLRGSGDGPSAAEAHFGRALEVARRQGARL